MNPLTYKSLRILPLLCLFLLGCQNNSAESYKFDLESEKSLKVNIPMKKWVNIKLHLVEKLSLFPECQLEKIVSWVV